MSNTTCGACGAALAYVNRNPTGGPPAWVLVNALALAGPSHRDTCAPWTKKESIK
jgi:hypothetical protein